MRNQKEMLDTIPVRLVDWYIDENTKLIVVKRPKFIAEWASKLFSPFLKKDHFSIKLDKIGTFVWQSIDGRKTVSGIGELLGKEFGPEIEPIYERLFKFIFEMHKAKLIKLLQEANQDASV